MAVLLFGLCAMPAAQAQNTTSSIEKSKSESLWTSTTDNAAGGMIDAQEKYATANFGFEREQGDFKPTQIGDDNTAFTFHTEGGGIYKQVNNMYLWGSFTYTRDDIEDARWNATLLDPLRGMPFFLADENYSDWKNQSYELAFKAGFPKLWDRLYVGIGATYKAAQGAKQIDPRPLTKLSDFSVTPSIVVDLGKQHHVGANFLYRSYREDGTASCLNPLSHQVYEMVAPGFFSPGTLSNLSNSANALRSYNANTLGGGLQYGYSQDNFEVVLSGNYAYKVEDVFCNYMYPQMSGTVKEHQWDLTLAGNYHFDNGNLLSLTFKHSDRDYVGIEYFQTFYNTAERQEWITDAVYERSNFQISDQMLKIDYMVADEELAYRWMFGLEGHLNDDYYIYYLPESVREVKTATLSAYAKRNIALAERHSLQIQVRGGFSSNLEGSFTYAGTRGESIAYTEFAVADYEYMCTDYTTFGGELAYTFKGLFKKTASLFASASYDHISPSGNAFDKRNVMLFKVGLNF